MFSVILEMNKDYALGYNDAMWGLLFRSSRSPFLDRNGEDNDYNTYDYHGLTEEEIKHSPPVNQLFYTLE
jgi:hypothetical protein